MDPLGTTTVETPTPTPQERVLALLGYLPGGLWILRAQGIKLSSFVLTHAFHALIIWWVILLSLLIFGLFSLIVTLAIIGYPAYRAFHGEIFLYPGVLAVIDQLRR